MLLSKEWTPLGFCGVLIQRLSSPLITLKYSEVVPTNQDGAFVLGTYDMTVLPKIRNKGLWAKVEVDYPVTFAHESLATAPAASQEAISETLEL